MLELIPTKNHYGIIGKPVGHSLSPYIHQSFANLCRLDINYHAIESEPENFTKNLREFLYYAKGVNVTSPFKELAIKAADEITKAAQLAQAANTLFKKEDNSIMADNTDGLGFIRDLTENQNFDPKNKVILILGAGGAARGILGPLIKHNPKTISISNRSFDKARLLAQYFKLDALALAQLNSRCFDLIIRASNALPELPQNFSAEGALCYDFNYGERAADFKRWAKQQRSTYLDGLGLLVEQAAESFYLWHGIKPPTAELIAELRKRSS